MDATAEARALSWAWVLLTMGDRPDQLRSAVDSITGFEPDASIVILYNGATPVAPPDGADVIVTDENLGVPTARDMAARHIDADIVVFLDDDAAILTDVGATAEREFAGDPELGAVSFRLVDEHGDTARRHIPRPGGRSDGRSGDVVGFLGGACAIRRSAYLDAGGYWGLLRYGHEELDLSWRLIDHGWGIRYLADARVFHPHTAISRHADGWRLTGRNRVLIARRNLPAPVMVAHVVAWLAAGWVRARRSGCGRAYVAGWWAGWRVPVERRPISWRTVWRLTRLGRPPVL